MFTRWGSFVHARRWPVLIIVATVAVLGGIWGAGVFDKLTQGGYEAPHSESMRASQIATAALGRTGGDVAVIYSAPAGGSLTDPATATKIADKLAALPRDAVSRVDSYWSVPPEARQQLTDTTGTRGLAVITLRSGDSNGQLTEWGKIKDGLAVDGVPSQIAGSAAIGDAINEASESDMVRAEMISMPLVLILLVVIFGGLVAASLPVAVGGLAILGSLGVLRLLTEFVEVNSFAVNVASLLGLGLAIDYGLFTVGRFREELLEGRAVPDAVRRTVGTAGRTVAFSATLLVLALAGLLFFPQPFLKSLAYGGMSAVAIAAIVSLTLLPAALAALGTRVDALAMPWRGRRARHATKDTGRGWRRLAWRVMRRPVLVAVPILGLLLLLGAPFLDVRFGEVNEKVLPADHPARAAAETLNRDFPGAAGDAAKIVLHGKDGHAPDQAAAQAFAEQLAGVPGVHAVTPSGAGGDVITISAKLPGAATSDEAVDALEKVRALPPPPDTDVLVDGMTARVTDSVNAIADTLPLMISVVVGATLLLLFLAFGSVILPIKAVVMSALSLSATFGVLVWIFQDGHGADLLGVTPGPLEAGIVVLMFAVVFGLSTDYEVFLMSRMVEARARGETTAQAVATGLERTGKVISAAAVLLILVTGAFALSDVGMMRFVGVGMILALALDATLVRMILVPAVMRILGDASWWAPGPLRRLQQRANLGETSDDDPPPPPPPPPPPRSQSRSREPEPEPFGWFSPVRSAAAARDDG
ncbi:RND superfamily putative drug exporter [Herbihabitans rhizosphaerae]|uniref:RND superfamily putative drug exporter n=1 Tax=Herbihabitans rhizosphaerae TaxID=1872711 RepID=A0A4Q7KM82_9PSEU|nr:MMPL family transporter [Herbihabitans rhizosphaerae]RZS37645.1 RND superfamily putative drug exporter [Herbihabitans rhizosphaerae]